MAQLLNRSPYGAAAFDPEKLATASSEDCKQLIFSQWGILEALSRKRFQDPNLADAALLAAQRGLEANDWRRVRAYRGQASFTAYLAQVTSRLLEDYARKVFGRKRPPAWIKRRGFLYERLYKLLCLDGASPAEAAGQLDQNATALAAEAIAEAIDAILSHILDCGGSALPRIADDVDVNTVLPEEPGLHQLNPEELYDKRQRDAFLEALRRGLGFHDAPAYDPDPELAERFFQALREALTLSADERLFLGMIYRDCVAVTTAGQMLGWSLNLAHSRLRSLLLRIRKSFETAAAQCGMRAVLAGLLAEKD